MSAAHLATVAVVASLLLGGCKSPLEKSYDEKLREAQSHCFSNGGDEFMPYGFSAWKAVFALNKPGTFRCVRLMKGWKRTLAVHSMKPSGDTIALEIR